MIARLLALALSRSARTGFYSVEMKVGGP